MTAVIERCAKCGGDLASARVIVGGHAFHVHCSHDARDQRIAELEAACRVALDAYSQVSGVRIPGTASGALVHAREALRRALGQL